MVLARAVCALPLVAGPVGIYIYIYIYLYMYERYFTYIFFYYLFVHGIYRVR